MNASAKTPDSATASAADTRSGSTLKPRLVMGAVVLAASAYLGHAWWFSEHYVETDNAQVDGHIIPVSPKIGGFVATVNVKENQHVKAGDVIATMDDRDYRSRLTQAEADYAQMLAAVGRGAQAGQAVAQIAAAAAQADAAQAEVAQAEADHDHAVRDAGRLHALLAQKLVSPQQYDAAADAARASSARLQAARESARAAVQQVSAARAALRGADARLEAAQAARDIAAHQLADTKIIAASDGVVSQKTVEVGQLMQPGQPMMNLVPLDDIWVVANLKETQVRDIRAGNTVRVEVDSYPGVDWTGTVESLSPATGSKFTLLPPDNATGNFTKIVQRIPVRVRLDPGQHPEYALRPGMSVTVRIDKNR
jgi:membrane fusion protein (multidrug efflux system)